MGTDAVICSPMSPAGIRMFSKSRDLIFFQQVMDDHVGEIQHKWIWEEDVLYEEPVAGRRYSDTLSL